MGETDPVPDRDRATYTHGHQEAVLRSHRWRTAENSCGYLLPHLEAGQSLLDVGCGPGTITIDLARRLAPGRVVGVDMAAEVVEALAGKGILGGVPLSRLYPNRDALGNYMLVAATETNTDEDIADLASALKEVLA